MYRFTVGEGGTLIGVFNVFVQEVLFLGIEGVLVVFISVLVISITVSVLSMLELTTVTAVTSAVSSAS